MDPKSLNKVSQTSVLKNLLFYHSEFQGFLDVVTASNLDNEIIDDLIQIRQFNINCISRYTDLISKGDIRIKPTPGEMFVVVDGQINQPLILTKIHNKLSNLIPAYFRALNNKSLKGFPRMIVGNNYEKIVSIKDNLLHPLPELQLA